MSFGVIDFFEQSQFQVNSLSNLESVYLIWIGKVPLYFQNLNMNKVLLYKNSGLLLLQIYFILTNHRLQPEGNCLNVKKHYFKGDNENIWKYLDFS